MKKQSQTWSFDLIVAVILFVVVIGIFYGFVMKDDEDLDSLQKATTKITYKLDCKFEENDECIVRDGAIDEEGLKFLFTEQNYELLKDQWNLDSDFCIYLRDASGNVIPFEGKTSFGSSDLVLTQSGKTCGSEVTP
ncbi:MAG: hypothetical protein PHU51_05065 [Candidatus Nanoarchaeia archaeon]|jgi:hypothetical protein|nr:hypothetical protein [Candidatus Nanoarchaeia archaeon]